MFFEKNDKSKQAKPHDTNMNIQKPNTLTVLIIIILTVLFAATVNATEDYAEVTGAECNSCHIDPLGGGELTELGKGYLLLVNPEIVQKYTSQGPASRIIKLIFGYIHIVTAFLWFGTILYVHLVLKPAASKGLPRSEVKVGLISMAIMAITGMVLTYYKVSSLSLLVSSKFGILLLVKIFIFTVMVSSALYVVFVIGPKLKKKKKLQPSQSGELTLAELANFDGEEGRPAYFAFKGKIYDVSQSKLWRNGNHMKRHQAGVDLTDILSQAPHDEDKILVMPEVGQLSMNKDATPNEVHKRIFYFMAYMNLGFVFIISLILALWRWY
jgi:predicted heme/steroid binding protein